MSFLDLIFPKNCYFCHSSGSYFCSNCIRQLSINSVHLRYCSPFNGLLNLFPYDSGLKEAIHDLKYNFISDITPEISALMYSCFKASFPNLLHYWQSQKFVCTSVSLYPYRHNWRGFNQSDLIASQFCQLASLKYQPNLVNRIYNNPSQVSQNSKLDRLSNVKNIFQLNSEISLPGNIIIFDDVCTTMSTLKSSVEPILSSGKIKEIWALTLAGCF